MSGFGEYQGLQDILHAEYVATSKRNGMQSEEGSRGHMHAVWTHRVTSKDVAALKAGGCMTFPLKADVPPWKMHY